MLALACIRISRVLRAVAQRDGHAVRLLDPAEVVDIQNGEPAPGPWPEGLLRIGAAGEVDPLLFGGDEVTARGRSQPRFEDGFNPVAAGSDEMGEVGHGVGLISVRAEGYRPLRGFRFSQCT